MSVNKVILNDEVLIDLTEDTVTEEDVTKGKTFHKADGSQAVGLGNTIVAKDTNFYDYDGTLLYSYDAEEALKLSALPELPTQPGLICQGWNHDLETIKAYRGYANVGAIYITDDGKTRLYVDFESMDRFYVRLALNIKTGKVSGGHVNIDWGDGSPVEQLSGNSTTSFLLARAEHNYPGEGKYVISIEGTDDVEIKLGASSSTCLFGTLNDAASLDVFGRNSLEKVEIGNNIVELSICTFYLCYNLKTVTMPAGITEIPENAFYGCRALKALMLPDSVVSIVTGAFRDCAAMSCISFSDNCTSFGNVAFMDSKIDYMVIPRYAGKNSVGGTIGNKNLRKVVIQDNVSLNVFSSMFGSCLLLASCRIYSTDAPLPTSMFNGDGMLDDVLLPDGLPSIMSLAFNTCRKLTHLVIPKTVTTIEASAFNNCSAMKYYDFSNHESVPTLTGNAFGGIRSDCEIRVPTALYEEWIAATNWSTYADNIVAV